MTNDTSSTDGLFSAVAHGGSKVLGTSGASAASIASVPLAVCKCSEAVRADNVEPFKNPTPKPNSVVDRGEDNGSEDHHILCSNPVEVINAEQLKEPSQETSPGSRKSRNKWLKIFKVQKVHGEFIISHPFLNDNNLKDQVILRHCLVEKPFMAPHGQQMKAWQNVANGINKYEMYAATSVFNPPVSAKTLKNRFMRYMSYARQCFEAELLKSECDDDDDDDDEATLSEVQMGVNDLSEMYEYFRSTEKTQIGEP